MNKLGRRKSLSGLDAWALAFGCIIGWGSFVMSGDAFLPQAGPLGTVIAIGLGTVIMGLIAFNFKYMMNRYPVNGGPFIYTGKTLGYDHAFMCAWFLGLSYITIIPQNATALTLILRIFAGDFFRFGYLYSFAGYEIYLGEVLVCLFVLVVVGILVYMGGRAIRLLNTCLAVFLALGVLVIAVSMLISDRSSLSNMVPAFAYNGNSHVVQVLAVLAVVPWAFVGFDTLAQSVEYFRFPVRRSLSIMITAILMGGGVYILLVLVTASTVPQGYSNWLAYIADSGNLEGLKTLPTFNAAYELLGEAGLVILVTAAICAVLTGVIGFFVATKRLLGSMAQKRVIPAWFLGGGEKKGHIVIFVVLISFAATLFGRTMLGWVVDISSVGAAVGFAYTSLTVIRISKEERSKKYRIIGWAGFILSVFFVIILVTPTSLMNSALEPESYLALALWGTLGFVLYWVMLRSREVRTERKNAMVIGISLMVVILFSSTVWLIQTIHRVYSSAEEAVGPGVSIHDGIHGSIVSAVIAHALLIAFAIVVMFAIYHTMQKQSEELEKEKIKAEEGSRLKSEFLSNMSHDIRTPMNAIIGYTDLALDNIEDTERARAYLTKIESSSKHLLTLINDVLEMSRIESGRIELEEDFVDIRAVFNELEGMVQGQAKAKELDLSFTLRDVKHPVLFCDRIRIEQILLNLISNAIKFTPIGGSVHIILSEGEQADDLHAAYELRVKDTGIGMSQEFARHVFEPFERERTSTASGIQGTGLGMAITKQIVEVMGGTIDLVTEKGQGTEFIINLMMRHKSVADKTVKENHGIAEKGDSAEAELADIDFAGKKALLVDDNMINREIAKAILLKYGLEVEEAADGDEAVARLEVSAPGQYDVILMDIQMPRMDGYEATREIRSLPDPALAHTPIIAMTADAFEEDVRKAEEAGMDGHVAKPIDIPNLITTIRDTLAR